MSFRMHYDVHICHFQFLASFLYDVFRCSDGDVDDSGGNGGRLALLACVIIGLALRVYYWCSKK